MVRREKDGPDDGQTDAFEAGSELRGGLTQWVGYCNAGRPHASLDGRTPDEAYAAGVAGNGEHERLAA